MILNDFFEYSTYLKYKQAFEYILNTTYFDPNIIKSQFLNSSLFNNSKTEKKNIYTSGKN